MLKELRKQLDQKELSSVELTEHYLAVIAEQNPKLNAFVKVMPEYALNQAKQADIAIAEGKITPLTGIPYALKDIYCVKGVETTGCSKILYGYVPPYTGTVAQKLAVGVLLGKTNTDEFAMGASTEHSSFGSTYNPHDITRVPGGSSGGSAAAVAAKMVPFSMGSDTGGSIRQPASFCGIVGLRPTYGRTSRYGVMPMASSMDTVGSFGETVEDVAIVLEQTAGKDVFDGNTVNHPVEHYAELLNQTLSGITVGIPKEYFEVAGLDPVIRTRMEEIIKNLEHDGFTVKSVSLPHTRYAVPAYYILVPSEVSANLARFDGIKYGARAKSADELIDVYKQSRAEGFGPEAKRRIMLGTYALSAGYYDAYYLKASKVRTLIRQDFDVVFKDVDILLTPATSTPAFVTGDKEDPIQMYLEDIFTAPASLAGIPGLVVPVGKVEHLPFGAQVMGPQWSEALVLRFGQYLENISTGLSHA